jgi:hypothetical protein
MPAWKAVGGEVYRKKPVRDDSMQVPTSARAVPETAILRKAQRGVCAIDFHSLQYRLHDVEGGDCLWVVGC